ncbi:MAG: B12-binding domain-containing radical SAM protein [Candidatus Aenigmarchaeota archaeon]|nr:B12-binding domain-containing radical SAM protein [Candidatus Aenigmarchaeota archaeon]
MEILLINPYTKFPGKSPSIPIGLLQLAALPNKNGHNVKILDCNKSSIEDVKKQIKKSDPDIIGFTGWTGQTLKIPIELSTFSRENTNSKIVWGGPHPSLLPRQVIKEDYVDFVIVGEGDLSFNNLIENIKNPEKVKGIFYKEKGKILSTGKSEICENLDTLPLMPWEIIDLKSYVFEWVDGMKSMVLPTSRGCPYNCSFCYNKSFYQRKWRPYSVKTIEENLENLLSLSPKIEAVRFDYEDNFLGNDPKRAIKISELAKKNDLKWGCQLRVNNSERSIIEKFKNNGCEYIFFGIESGSQRILDFLRKGITVGQSVKVFDICNELKIRAVAGLMLDIPTEKNEDFKKTIKLAERLNNIVNVGFYQPYPGTDLFDHVVINGFVPPQSTEEWSNFKMSSYHNFSEVSSAKLKFAYYYLNNVLNPAVLLKKKDYKTFYMLLKTVLKI